MVSGSGPVPPAPTTGQPVFEESYIENILRLNLGKIATVYMTFENNNQWNAKVFKGRLEAAQNPTKSERSRSAAVVVRG